jgi:hypothetical protein
MVSQLVSQKCFALKVMSVMSVMHRLMKNNKQKRFGTTQTHTNTKKYKYIYAGPSKRFDF